jgi:hypothetical protein
MLTGSRITIKLFADKASIITGRNVEIKSTNLPAFADYFKTPAFLTVEILAVDLTDKSIYVKILTYHSGQGKFTQTQKNEAKLLALIENIKFKSIGTIELMRIMKANKEISLKTKKEKIFIESKTTISPPIKNNLSATKGDKNLEKNKNSNTKKETLISIEDFFKLNVKDLRFRYGYVSFIRWVDALDQKVEFSIYNHNIREEYDAIKNYFSNILQSKRLEVRTKIVINDGIVELSEAYSKEIQEIDDNFIDALRIDYVKKLKKKRLSMFIDKTLFTMDEYFDALSEEKINSDTFYTDERDFLEDLIGISNTKHYQNLRYLSDKHAYHIMKLRFVLKPFSFIFLIEAEQFYHLVWETLDTREATYIWRFEKEIKTLRHHVKQIEGIITQLTTVGKKAYIALPDPNFRRVFHDYSALVNGFVKWKGEIDSILI